MIFIPSLDFITPEVDAAISKSAPVPIPLLPTENLISVPKTVSDTLPYTLLVQSLSVNASNSVINQGIKKSSILLIKKAFLHYQGSHQNLEITFDDLEIMRNSFEIEHKKRFGFYVKDRKILIEMLTVEAVGKSSENYDFSNIESPSSDAIAIDNKEMIVNGLKTNVPIYQRSNLKVEQIISGPAIISEPTGTNIIDEGWSANLDKFHNLILNRTEKKINKKAKFNLFILRITFIIFNKKFIYYLHVFF